MYYEQEDEESTVKKIEENMVIPVEVTNKFIFGPVLGRGHYSVVRMCTSKETGEEYAIKIVSKVLITNMNETHETEILSKVKHPNIISLHSVFDSPTHKFIIMELVTDGELFDEIVKRGFFSETDAACIIHQIAQAVRYLHLHGIVHRDLKPENCLLSTKDDMLTIKVADFGLSKIVSPEAILMTPCGTPSCVAPEVLLGHGYSKEVDLWAIGVILYILLSGYPPFGADLNEESEHELNELYERILNGQYDFPFEYWAGVSDEARDLVSKLLVVDPKKRLTVEQLLNHPWLTQQLNECSAEDYQSKLVVQNMKDYNAKRKLRTVLLKLTSSLTAKFSDVSPEIEEQWKKLFRETAGAKGKISVATLRTTLGKLNLDVFNDRIRELSRQHGENNPSIDMETFLYYAKSLPPKLSESFMVKAFDKLDINKDGKITKDDVSKVCIQLQLPVEDEKEIRKITKLETSQAKLSLSGFLQILREDEPKTI